MRHFRFPRRRDKAVFFCSRSTIVVCMRSVLGGGQKKEREKPAAALLPSSIWHRGGRGKKGNGWLGGPETERGGGRREASLFFRFFGGREWRFVLCDPFLCMARHRCDFCQFCIFKRRSGQPCGRRRKVSRSPPVHSVILPPVFPFFPSLLVLMLLLLDPAMCHGHFGFLRL